MLQIYVFLVNSSIFGEISSNSFHYDIRFTLDWHRDFLELEFSLPKALYGTNIFQNIQIAPKAREKK